MFFAGLWMTLNKESIFLKIFKVGLKSFFFNDYEKEQTKKKNFKWNYLRLLTPNTSTSFQLCALKILELSGKTNNSCY